MSGLPVTVDIYLITNGVNGKQYVGIAGNYRERWKGHLSSVQKKSRQLIHKAIAKHGVESFVLELIEQCNMKDGPHREIFHIARLGTFGNGYNQTKGGEGKFGYVTSEETKEKIRSKVKGFKHTKAAKDKLRIAHTGRSISEERKQAISRANKGRKRLDIALRSAKPVVQYDLDGNAIAEYESISSASKMTSWEGRSISQVCNHKRHQMNGFVFLFKGDPFQPKKFRRRRK